MMIFKTSIVNLNVYCTFICHFMSFHQDRLVISLEAKMNVLRNILFPSQGLFFWECSIYNIMG